MKNWKDFCITALPYVMLWLLDFNWLQLGWAEYLAVGALLFFTQANAYGRGLDTGVEIVKRVYEIE